VASFIDLPLRSDGEGFNVVVEAPRGSTVKLKYEPELDAFVFERPLLLGVSYPYDWGFFPSTRADDGDPLDAMVLFDAPTWPGVVISAVPIGIVRLVQKEKPKTKVERNDRVIAVPMRDQRYGHVRDLPRRVKRELEEFFVTAAKMNDKAVTVEGWDGPKAAAKAILSAGEAYVTRASK